MKKILCILLILFLSFVVFAATDLSLAPAMGMMKTHYIIARDNENDDLYNYLINKDKDGNLSDALSDNQGRVDNIAIAVLSINEVDYSTGWGDDYTDKGKVTITVFYDGYFRSDDNPTIIRPYELYFVERTNRNMYYVSDDVYPSSSHVKGKIDSDSPISFPSQEILDKYKWWITHKTSFFWCDFVLQLPQDSVDANGVTVDGVYYPLIEGRYSSEVTITATLYDNNNAIIGSDAITVPLMAEHTKNTFSMEAAERNSQVSLNVETNANALNLNLDTMLATGNPVNIGDMVFMLRAGKNSTKNSLTPTEKLCEDLDNGLQYVIFLSASEDPFTPNQDGFKFIHEDFVHGISSYNDTNSVNFYVSVSGKDESSDQSAIYDGKAYANTDGTINNGSALFTRCHKLRVLDESDFTHYHTYDGDISVFVQQNASAMLNAGRYRGDIYVHVISY